MTKINRKITVSSDPEKMWKLLDIRKWSEISDIFTEISLNNGGIALGSEARITAGPGEEKVNYTAKITALEPAKKLAYERSGGPLPGTSEWELTPEDGRTVVTYRNTFDHALAEPVKNSMAKTMERFLVHMKTAVENGTSN